MLESGVWERKTTHEEANVFNGGYATAKVFLTPEFNPGVIYSFRIGSGVGPNFVRSELKAFVEVMKYFGSWTWLPSSELAPAPAAGSFSSGPMIGGTAPMGAGNAKPMLYGQPTQR